MVRLAVVILLTVSVSAGAVVIRDDVDDSQYRISRTEFPALADMPGEGHGVLIAPQWVVTAAHAVCWQHAIQYISINGTARRVERLIVHPGYKPLPQALIDEALKSGDATRVMAFIASSDDIALLKLAEPVQDVQPIAIYLDDALGKVVRIVGKGATSTGATGHDPHGPNRTELRHAFNEINSSEGRWLGYVFDRPPLALPLEGVSGNGDSGGPVLIGVGDTWEVAGLTSWKRAQGNPNPNTYRPGVYGQTNYNVRLNHYIDWIRNIMAPESSPAVIVRCCASQ